MNTTRKNNSIKPPSKVVLVSSENDKAIVMAMEQAGFKVEIFNDVSKAEKNLKLIKPNLILVYSNLTNDHGLHFCQLVRDSEINPRPIIVFLVHEENPDERIEVLRVGKRDSVYL